MRGGLATLSAGLLLASAPAAAGLPARQQALVLLRVLVYDRALPARAGAAVKVALVFRAGDGRSEAECHDLQVALQGIAQEAVAAGRPIRAVEVAYAGGADLARRLQGERPAVLYACAGLEEEVGTLARVAREHKVLAASASRAMAEEGLGVALVDRGERAGVIVNPRAAAAQGADLDSALLTLAELVGGPRPAGP